MRHAPLHTLLAALLVGGCTGAIVPGTGGTTTAVTTDTADTGTPPTGAALSATVTELTCDYDAYYAPPPELLTASSSAPGQVDVTHQSFTWACAPELTVTPTLDAATATIDIAYGLYDLQDCVCLFHVSYTLGPVPAGDWTVTADGQADTVTVL